MLLSVTNELTPSAQALHVAMETPATHNSIRERGTAIVRTFTDELETTSVLSVSAKVTRIQIDEEVAERDRIRTQLLYEEIDSASE